MASQLNPEMDKAMKDLLFKARSETDASVQVAMYSTVMKWEALKLKAQQGQMGSSFDDPGDES